MEVGSRGRATELQVSRKWKGRDHQHQLHHHHLNLYQQQRMRSPERTKVWTEPPPPNRNKSSNITTTTTTNGVGSERKVPVIYYLSRNGQLEHPHFMDVPLSAPEGLYLRDVINRLNLLRGKGMASQYSWSSKRGYKNGFVWHDLSEDDFIYPAQGQEYVLKGSELLEPSSLSSSSLLVSKTLETASSSSFRATKSGDGSSDFPVIVRRRNQSWSSIDLNEYKVYKTEPASESTRLLAADASTQTDDKRRRRRPPVEAEEDDEKSQSQSQSQTESQSQGSCENQSIELSREDISPPPSDSSPETLESLMKADGRLILCPGSSNEDSLNRTGDNFPSGRMKASTVLMQLISCGSISFKDCGPSQVKDQGFSLLGHYKARLPRVTGDKKEVQAEKEISNFSRVRLEDKEYFSGSLIETNIKEDIPPALKRSNSYNADRSSQMQLGEKEVDGVRAKCIPRRLKAVPTKKESNMEACVESDGSQNVNKSVEV